MIGLILVLTILLSLSAFFSSTETIFYLSDEKIRNKYIKTDYDTFLVFILLSNTIVNIFIGITSEKIFSENLIKDKSIIFSIVISTSILLFFGEIIPKRLALILYSGTNNIFLFLMQKWIDLIKFFEKLINFFIKPIKKIENEDKTFSILEIKNVLSDGIIRGYFNPVQASLISNLVSQSFSTIKDHIIHYSELPDINGQASIEDIFNAFKNCNLKKLPVTSKNKKTIFGYISKGDFLNSIIDKSDDKSFNIKNIIRPLNMIYEYESIEVGIHRFIEAEETILGVYDEHFQYCGIIDYYKLIDDMLFDISIASNKKLPIILNANISCRSLFYNYNINIQEKDFDLKLVEIVLNKLGKIPEVGDSISYLGYKITIVKMKNKKIVSLKIDKDSNKEDQ